MTHDQRTAAVRASLLVDDARETHHAIYPVRGRETGRSTVQTRRSETVPGAALAAAVARVYAAKREGL